jgi:membrane associated rhomboid family serine protease
VIRNLPPLTRWLVIGLAAALGVCILVPKVGYLLPLYGLAVTQGFQVWRIVTWPFYSHNLFGSLFSVLLIFYFGTELETIVHTRKLSIFLIFSVFISGILFTLLSKEEILAGPDFVYLFILTGFTYLWPQREISIFGMFFVKAWIISLIIVLLDLIPMQGLHLDLGLTRIFPVALAISTALLFFHFSYKQYRFGSALIASIEGLMWWRSNRVRGRDATWDEKLTVEHRIDAILDKISRKGIDSLTAQERDYLLKHSQK